MFLAPKIWKENLEKNYTFICFVLIFEKDFLQDCLLHCLTHGFNRQRFSWIRLFHIATMRFITHIRIIIARKCRKLVLAQKNINIQCHTASEHPSWFLKSGNQMTAFSLWKALWVETPSFSCKHQNLDRRESWNCWV